MNVQASLAHLLRISKATAGFEHRGWKVEDVKAAFDHFLIARKAYDSEKVLKKLMK